jgi:hypothetical protein
MSDDRKLETYVSVILGSIVILFVIGFLVASISDTGTGGDIANTIGSGERNIQEINFIRGSGPINLNQDTW